jgi:hypothetical protein
MKIESMGYANESSNQNGNCDNGRGGKTDIFSNPRHKHRSITPMMANNQKKHVD